MRRFDAHVSTALLNLPLPFWGKPRIGGLTAIGAGRAQQLENVFADLITAFDVNQAVGHQLKLLGEFVGQQNFGFEDPTYRLLVKSRILVNRSNGGRNDLITVAKIFFENYLGLRRIEPGVTRLIQWGNKVDQSLLIARLQLQDTVAANVALYYYTCGVEGQLGGTVSDPDVGHVSGSVHNEDAGTPAYHVEIL